MAQDNKISDINDLVIFLAATGMKPLLDDEIWQCYGYPKVPKKGSVWVKLFPKKFALENFISKELLTMGLIDILNGIKKSKENHETKLLLAVGVVDHFLETTEHMFATKELMQNLFSTYTSYLNGDKSKLHEPIILKAKDVLDKKDFAKFMVGTIRLLSIEHASDYLLKSEYIKNIVEKSDKENKLKISMTDEAYKRYVPMIEDKILNSDKI